MLTKIKKWGNSQGLRFSKEVLQEAGIDVGEDVQVFARKGQIVIQPAARIRGKYKLEDLLKKMPKDYKPYEVDWGKPVGKEVW